MSLEEYNNNLRLQDAARARRAAQPAGLAASQKSKQEKEAAALAPYTVEKDKYYRAYNVILDGEIVKTFDKKADAVAWVMSEKERPETISEEAAPETVAQAEQEAAPEAVAALPEEEKEERPETISNNEKKEGKKTMKYEKIEYSVMGRYAGFEKYGIITRCPVSGYTADGLEGVALRKEKNWWYVDHIETGLAVVTVGSKTREAAAKEYLENYAERVKEAEKRMGDKMRENFRNAPLESEVETWETVNYCTTSNYRFDKVSDAARRAGLLIRKADDNTYMDGGNINIIGAPEALKVIREMIAEYEKRDAERAAEEAAQAEPEAAPEAVAALPEAEKEEERPETISEEEAAPEAAQTEPEEAEAEPEEAARADGYKPARGPVKPKDFVAEALTGRGWCIVFDTGMQRTRVIVQEGIREAVAPMIQEAGFYWSDNMRSYNKKLTHKAHRAALALAEKLEAATA